MAFCRLMIIRNSVIKQLFFGMTNIKGRILELSNLYSSNKKFLEKCKINNASLLSELKSGRTRTPSADVLANIVEGTGCSGSWLLTGQGKMFNSDDTGQFDLNEDIIRALNLLNRIEQKLNGSSNNKLPKDLEVQLTELLLKVLQNR